MIASQPGPGIGARWTGDLLFPTRGGKLFVGEPGASPPPTGPVFRFECPAGCDPVAAAQCRNVLRRAIRDAINLASNAADKLEASPRDADTVRLFRFFFGHDPSRPVPWAGNKESGASVAHRFRKVAEALQGRGTLYRCGCPGAAPTVNARASRPNTVRLCPRFWGQSAAFRAGIVLHEMLHLLYEFFRHFRTPPHPNDPQERRRDNSHCYEAFAMRVAGHAAARSDVTRCRARPV